MAVTTSPAENCQRRRICRRIIAIAKVKYEHGTFFHLSQSTTGRLSTNSKNKQYIPLGGLAGAGSGLVCVEE